MRLYGSIRLPIFKSLNPRIGFITDRLGAHHSRYTPNEIDSTTLMRGGSASPAVHPLAFLFGCAVGFLIFFVVIPYYLLR